MLVTVVPASIYSRYQKIRARWQGDGDNDDVDQIRINFTPITKKS